MANITNLEQFLTDVATAIRTKKETTGQIPAENFDQEILSIETIKGQEKTIIPSTAEQILTPDGDYNAITKATIKAVDNTIDSNISPENIKKDINILGVTGTLEEGERINNQDKEITTNGTYTADEGYTGFGTVTVNVPQESGSGDVKLFETEEQMQADPDAKEGDLAVVYRSEIQSATVDSKFQVATFPETVVLDTAITDYVDIMYRAVDSSVMFDCWGMIDSSRFNMNCYTDSGEIRIQYTSSDGITYTRTDTTGNPVDFGTEIYYRYAEDWNDAIGKFIHAGGMYFDGLYEYGNITYKDKIKFSPLSAISFDYDGSTVSNVAYSGETVGDIYSLESIMNMYSKIENEVVTGDNVMEFFLNSQHELCAAVPIKSEVRHLYLTSELQALGFGQSNNTLEGMRIYKIDLKNETYTLLESINGGGNGSNYYNPYSDILTIPVLISGTSSSPTIPWWLHISSGQGTSTKRLNVDNVIGTYPYYNNIEYHIATTQLNLTKPNELLPGKIAYGKNGVIESDGTIWNNVPSGDIFTNYYGLNKIDSKHYGNENTNKYISVYDITEKTDKLLYLKKQNEFSDDDITLCKFDRNKITVSSSYEYKYPGCRYCLSDNKLYDLQELEYSTSDRVISYFVSAFKQYVYGVNVAYDSIVRVNLSSGEVNTLISKYEDDNISVKNVFNLEEYDVAFYSYSLGSATENRRFVANLINRDTLETIEVLNETVTYSSAVYNNEPNLTVFEDDSFIYLIIQTRTAPSIYYHNIWKINKSDNTITKILSDSTTMIMPGLVTGRRLPLRIDNKFYIPYTLNSIFETVYEIDLVNFTAYKSTDAVIKDTSYTDLNFKLLPVTYYYDDGKLNCIAYRDNTYRFCRIHWELVNDVPTMILDEYAPINYTYTTSSEIIVNNTIETIGISGQIFNINKQWKVSSSGYSDFYELEYYSISNISDYDVILVDGCIDTNRNVNGKKMLINVIKEQNTISQEEYNTAVTTANEILGEEV